MMQTLEELENWYANPDPWAYETNPDDAERKKRILNILPGKYKRALDIGCGEGWVTKDLPVQEIHGLELSETARARFPANVKSVTEPEGEYDLIVATGVLYEHYDWREMLELIKKHSSGTILIAGIKGWLMDTSKLGEAKIETFKYREYEQELRLYT